MLWLAILSIMQICTYFRDFPTLTASARDWRFCSLACVRFMVHTSDTSKPSAKQYSSSAPGRNACLLLRIALLTKQEGTEKPPKCSFISGHLPKLSIPTSMPSAEGSQSITAQISASRAKSIAKMLKARMTEMKPLSLAQQLQLGRSCYKHTLLS